MIISKGDLIWYKGLRCEVVDKIIVNSQMFLIVRSINEDPESIDEGYVTMDIIDVADDIFYPDTLEIQAAHNRLEALDNERIAIINQMDKAAFAMIDSIEDMPTWPE